MNYDKIAPIKNLTRAASIFGYLSSPEALATNMNIGLLHGAPGTGKTTALIYMRNQYNGIYLYCSPNWSPLTLLQDIGTELGLGKFGRIRTQESAVVERLSITRRPIFFDEFDYVLNNKRLFETVRLLHDLSHIPMLFIGMDEIERKLSMHPQFDRRVSQRVQLGAIDLADLKILAKAICTHEFAGDVLERVLAESDGSVAYAAQNLMRLDASAGMVEGKVRIGSLPDFEFSSPKRRHVA